MTQVSRTTFKSNTATLYADNTTGEIGAGDLRAQMNDIADSTVFRKTAQINAPTANDDSANTAGNGVFGVGDVWIDEANDQAYVCLDASVGTAVWTEITFTNAAAITASGGPAPDEIPVFTTPTNVASTDGRLTWNGTFLGVTGNIEVSGTVDGRDIAADGTKLDGIPSNAISSISLVNDTIGGSSTAFNITSLQVATGDGLGVTTPSAGVARIEMRNNDVTADTSNRTLTSTDNNSFITNRGAVGTVRWTLPATGTLQSVPRLVAVFYKTENQTMEIIGSTGTVINGVLESGANETLKQICQVPYTSFTYVFYSGVPGNYTIIESNNVVKVGTPAITQVGLWTGDGTIQGDPSLTYSGGTLNVNGEVKYNWTFNPQVGLTYTFVLDDRGRIITMDNASPNTVTIPANASIAFPIGTELKVIQIGAGATTISGDTGVTLNGVSAGSGAVTAQWGEVRLYKVAADEWYATGDIGAVA